MNDTQNINAFNAVQATQGTGKQYTSGQGIAPVAPVITADGLAGATPITIPPTTPTTPTTPVVTSPVGATLDANGNAIVAPQNTSGTAANPTAPATPTPSTKMTDYLNSVGISASDIATLGTRGTVTSQLQDQYGLADKTQAAAQSYNAYNQKKLEIQQTIEKMQSTNESGQLDPARQAQIADYSRKSNADLANLAIIAQANQGLLSATQQTIKDKIDAQFQPLQDKINLQLQIAQASNNDLSESQKFNLTQKADKNKTDLANVTSVSEDLHKALASNGAPQSVYSSLDKISNDFISGKISATEAQNKMYAAAGQYARTNKYSFQAITDAFGNQHIITLDNNTGKQIGSSDVNAVNGGGGTGYNAPQNIAYKNAFEQVIAGASPLIARPQRAQLDSLLAAGNIEGAKEYITSKAMEKFGQTSQQNAVNRLDAINALDKIKTDLAAAKAAGVSTNLLTGSAEQIAQKLGASTDPRIAYIGNEITLANNVYRKAMTGVQFSDKEAATYAKIFPNISNLDNLNEAKISSLIDSFKGQQATEVGAAIGSSNYNQIFGDGSAGSNPTSAKEGDTHLYNGVNYKLIKGVWTPQ